MRLEDLWSWMPNEEERKRNRQLLGSWLTGGGTQSPFEATMGLPGNDPFTVPFEITGPPPGATTIEDASKFQAEQDRITDPKTDDKDVWASRWLLGLAVVGIGVTCAPVAYKAFLRPRRGKRSKEASDIGESLDFASSRATTLLAALLPAAGLPIAYITVQALEKKNIITSGLGNAVQSLIAAGAVAPAIGGIGDLVKAVK
jgi:hypothetical protein